MAKFFGIGHIIHNVPNKNTYEGHNISSAPIVNPSLSVIDSAKPVLVEKEISVKPAIEKILEVSAPTTITTTAEPAVDTSPSLPAVQPAQDISASAVESEAPVISTPEPTVSLAEAPTAELDPVFSDFSLSKKSDNTGKRNKKRFG